MVVDRIVIEDVFGAYRVRVTGAIHNRENGYITMLAESLIHVDAETVSRIKKVQKSLEDILADAIGITRNKEAREQKKPIQFNGKV